MSGIIAFGFVMICIGAGIAFFVSAKVIERLERKIKRLDMATGYRFRSEIQN